MKGRDTVTNPSAMTWVVETEAFSPEYASFCDAVVDSGHEIVRWKWNSGDTLLNS